MKRRLLASLLSVMMLSTLFAGFTVWADAQVVTTFIDTDMTNTTANIPTGHGLTDDAVLNSKVANYEVPVGDSFSTARCRDATTESYGKLSSTGVLWGEISIKYEGAFTRLGWEHDQASPVVWIDDDGSIRTGGYNIHKRPAQEVGSDTGYDLELGKWYHIVSALDYTATSTGKLTIWVNGEKIVNAATPYSRLQGGAGFVYVDLKLIQAKDTASTVYIDNYRSYVTAATDSHPENSALSDADSTDEITIVSNYIAGASNATVAQVEAAFTNGDKLVFVKDGEVLAEDANVFGATAYAPFANGKGFRTYDIAAADAQLITKTYLDANIDNWTSGTSMLNSDGTSATNQWAGSTGNNSVQNGVEKGGKVLKFANIPPYDGTSNGYYVRNRLNTVAANYSECKVLWSEFSIKYEGGFKRFGFGENTSANCMFGINNEGTVVKFIPNAGYKASGIFGTPVNAERLELGKWYHFVAALDFTDAKAGTDGAPLYIWMNGELIENGGRSTLFKSTNSWQYHKLWVAKYGSETASIYLDNLKVYETLTVDPHAAADFAISAIDANADDNIYIEDANIVIPQNATVADVKNAIRADNYVFVKNGAVLSDNESALGSIMTVNASNGVGFKQYEVVDRVIKDIIGPIGESAVTSIMASIPTSNAAHPIAAMINNGKYAYNDRDVYKSKDDITDDLVVTINLDAYYALQNVTVYERWVSGSSRSVTVDLAKNGVFTNVATDVPLTTGTTYLYSTPTVVAFNETEADTIRLTFKCIETTGDKQKYQIFEIEADGIKSGDIPVHEKISVGGEGNPLTSFTASIPTRAGAHPVTGMIDGNREFHSSNGGSDASLYKSHHSMDSKPLTVLFTFDGVYNVSNVKVFERRAENTQNIVTVSVYAGLNGNLTEIASDVALASASNGSKAFETSVVVPWTDADAVMLVFENAGDYAGAESSYQFSEIEVYGEKVGEVSATAILPAYSFGELTTNSFIVSISNASDVALEGVVLVAAYQGDELVALTPARDVIFGKGVTAQYTFDAAGIIADGREYKVFLWNNMNDAKPLLVSKVITK